jgi:hypothetical protein
MAEGYIHHEIATGNDESVQEGATIFESEDPNEKIVYVSGYHPDNNNEGSASVNQDEFAQDIIKFTGFESFAHDNGDWYKPIEGFTPTHKEAMNDAQFE